MWSKQECIPIEQSQLEYKDLAHTACFVAIYKVWYLTVFKY